MGRLTRLALAGLLGWVAYDLWMDRVFIVAGTDPVHDPGLWFLTAMGAALLTGPVFASCYWYLWCWWG